jgi:hypothetical protein
MMTTRTVIFLARLRNTQIGNGFMLSKMFGVVLCLIFLGGCQSSYRPLKIDSKTSFYPTTTELDAGATTVFSTSTDPATFPIILLSTSANLRSQVFEFMMRDALAQAGMIKVFTPVEFMALAKSKGIDLGNRNQIDATVVEFSSRIVPVLAITYDLQWDGDVRRYSRLKVVDGRSGQALLELNQNRLIWADADSEAIYPVLNQLRKWIKASSKSGA